MSKSITQTQTAMRKLVVSDDRRVVLVRFLVVGGMLAAAYAGLSSLLHVGAGLSAPAASALSYGITIPPAYWCQRVLAFRSTVPHRQAFPRYVFLQAPLLLLGALLSWVLIDLMHGPRILSFFVVAPTVAGISFVAQRIWTFAKQ